MAHRQTKKCHCLFGCLTCMLYWMECACRMAAIRAKVWYEHFSKMFGMIFYWVFMFLMSYVGREKESKRKEENSFLRIPTWNSKYGQRMLQQYQQHLTPTSNTSNSNTNSSNDALNFRLPPDYVLAIFHCVHFPFCAVSTFFGSPRFMSEKTMNGCAFTSVKNTAFGSGASFFFCYTCYILCDSHHMHRLRFSSSFFISWQSAFVQQTHISTPIKRLVSYTRCLFLSLFLSVVRLVFTATSMCICVCDFHSIFL